MEDVEPALTQSLRAHSSDVNCVDFYGNSRLATASSDKTVRLWSWTPGLGFVEVEHSPARGHKYGVVCVRFSPQGTMLASCSIDGTTRVWSARDLHNTHRLLQPGGHGVRVCCFTPDSRRLVTGAEDGSVCVWDLLLKQLVRRLTGHEGTVQALCTCAEGALLLTTCTLGVIKLYSMRALVESEEGVTVSELRAQDDAHDMGVLTADSAPQACDARDLHDDSNEDATTGTTWRACRVATGGQDSRVRVWVAEWRNGIKSGGGASAATLRLLLTLDGHTSAVTCVRWSGSGAVLASTSIDKTVRTWNSLNGRCIRLLDAHARYVNTVAFSHDDLLMATGSNDKTVRVWSLLVGLGVDGALEPPCSVLSHFASGDLAGIGPAEGALATLGGARGEAACLWSDTTTHAGSVNCVVFSGDHILATACSDRCVRVFRWSELEAALEPACPPLVAHRYPVTAVHFHPVGPDALISASLDGTAILWDIETGCRLCTMSVESASGVKGESGGAGGGGARDARVSPHRTTPLVLVASDDHVAPVWRLADRSTEPAHVYRGHTDAVSCCAWAPDGSLLVTASHNGDFRLYRALPPAADTTALRPADTRQLHVQDDAHDLGVQSCDFAASATAVSQDRAALLLATAGNDSLAKLWLLIHNEDEERVSVRLVRSLVGHGGNVLCVRFSPGAELLASAATDKHARVWCCGTGRCVAAVAHGAGAAACALSATRLLAVGCLDGQLALWRLPPPTNCVTESLACEVRKVKGIRLIVHLLKQAAEGVQSEAGEETAWWGGGIGRGMLRSWSRADLATWIQEYVVRAPELREYDGECVSAGDGQDSASWRQRLVSRVLSGTLDGAGVATTPLPELLRLLGCEDPESALGRVLTEELSWLKEREEVMTSATEGGKGLGLGAGREEETPHHLLCPVTHQIMLEPVKCADGFTYERAAILEWFLSTGKLVSPMTNRPLLNAELSPNYEMKRAVRRHLLTLQEQREPETAVEVQVNEEDSQRDADLLIP